MARRTLQSDIQCDNKARKVFLNINIYPIYIDWEFWNIWLVSNSGTDRRQLSGVYSRSGVEDDVELSILYEL